MTEIVCRCGNFKCKLSYADNKYDITGFMLCFHWISSHQHPMLSLGGGMRTIELSFLFYSVYLSYCSSNINTYSYFYKNSFYFIKKTKHNSTRFNH